MTAPRGLHTLARLHGIQTAYTDNEGRRVGASPEALLAALRALRVELPDTDRIPERVEHRRRTLWERALEPVVVAWARDGDEADGAFVLRLPARLRDRPVRIAVELEAGGERERTADPDAMEELRRESVGGTDYLERRVPLPAVPVGYHDLRVDVGDGRARRRLEARLVAAPARAPGWDALPGPAHERHAGWGLFAPLYALHDSDDPAPTFPLLGRFADRAADAGASVIGTLPLLAAFLDRPYEPSPYAPASRLFWNALYVRPETGDVRGDAWVGEDGLVDPRAAMAERRPLLEAEARSLFDQARGPGEGTDSGDEEGRGVGLGGPPEIDAFRARNPRVDDYARFRAITEQRGPWPGWPDRLRARDVRPGDFDVDVARYHLYVQWRAERQLAGVAAHAARRHVSLYLDLPMGVHSAGFDVWRERALFATGATAGAPPDPLAQGGQDWGFPPLNPEAGRLQHHRYFIDAIRTHLRFARVLRIDHVMQLHRMFWVPGGDAREGVYVRYPAEELYAILCLEARRAGAVIVGEDLGTVPRVVRREMRRRGMPGMYVLEFELEDVVAGEPNGEVDAEESEEAAHREPDALVPKPPPAGALASIGTHDTPTFAGWWWGEDIRVREELGHLEPESAERERRGRAVMREKLMRGLDIDIDVDIEEGEGDGRGERVGGRRVEEALLRRMGRSDAGLVLAALEDLWLERDPQNVPGTTVETNWRRRARRPLGALSDPGEASLLNALNESRKESQ